MEAMIKIQLQASNYVENIEKILKINIVTNPKEEEDPKAWR